MKFFAAPLQGFTESAWRMAHASLAGGIDEYFAPFVRVERGKVRDRDLRDYLVDSQSTTHEVTPQAIFRDAEELRMIVEALAKAGASRIDLNMGCPFPPQVNKGRGAAMVGRPDELVRVGRVIELLPEIRFSIKMRLGVDYPGLWREAMAVINEMSLRHLTVHPRTAVMQYAGELLFDQFDEIVGLCRKPLIYNGDLLTPDDISDIAERYPTLDGVMIGRGLLQRPMLAAEWRGREEYDPSSRLGTLLKIHDEVYNCYCSTLTGGDHQILQKIKPFWTYAADLLPRKTAKAIHKSATLKKYLSAVDSLRG